MALSSLTYLVLDPGMFTSLLGQVLPVVTPIALAGPAYWVLFTLVGTTASIGATLVRPDDTVDCALLRADGLLYRTKEAGRDRVVMDPQHDDAVKQDSPRTAPRTAPPSPPDRSPAMLG